MGRTEHIAVAAAYDGEKQVGARIINYSGTENKVLTNKQILNLMDIGKVIRNIRLEDGEIRWCQGSVNRYPRIQLDKNMTVSNVRTLVVIGRYPSQKNNMRIYRVANHLGDVVDIKESILISYGEEHGIANCKITSRNGVKYISSLSGDIGQIRTTPEFRLEQKDVTSEEKLIVYMPDIVIDTLKIPSKINGVELRDYKKLCIKPAHRGSEIKRLILPETVNTLWAGHMEGLDNLEELIHLGVIGWGTWGPFAHRKKVKRVYIREAVDRNFKMFSGLDKLEQVRFGVRPREICAGMFEGCQSLPIEDMIYEGIVDIKREAYENCLNLTDIRLPKTLRYLDVRAFKGCRNIRTLVITNSCTELLGSDGGSGSKLLEDSPNAVLYYPYNFREDELKEKVAKHVKLVRMEPTKRNIVANERTNKARLLGHIVKDRSIVTNYKEALGFLTVMSMEEFKRIVESEIKLQAEGYSYESVLISNGNNYMRVNIDSFRRGILQDVVDIGATDNYSYIIRKEGIQVVITNRDKVREYIGVGKDLKMSNWGMGDRERQFILKIPTDTIYVKAIDISSVYENDGKLVVETKQGEVGYVEM